MCRTPLYVGLPSVWGSEDGDPMFSLYVGRRDSGRHTWMNEWMNEWVNERIESPRLASGSGDGVSLSVGTLSGNMEWAPLPGTVRENKRYIKRCKTALQLGISLPRGRNGEPAGDSLAGTFWEKRIIYLGSFLGPRGYYEFKSGGHLELWSRDRVLLGWYQIRGHKGPVYKA